MALSYIPTSTSSATRRQSFFNASDPYSVAGGGHTAYRPLTVPGPQGRLRMTDPLEARAQQAMFEANPGLRREYAIQNFAQNGMPSQSQSMIPQPRMLYGTTRGDINLDAIQDGTAQEFTIPIDRIPGEAGPSEMHVGLSPGGRAFLMPPSGWKGGRDYGTMTPQEGEAARQAGRARAEERRLYALNNRRRYYGLPSFVPSSGTASVPGGVPTAPHPRYDLSKSATIRQDKALPGFNNTDSAMIRRLSETGVKSLKDLEGEYTAYDLGQFAKSLYTQQLDGYASVTGEGRDKVVSSANGVLAKLKTLLGDEEFNTIVEQATRERKVRQESRVRDREFSDRVPTDPQSFMF